MKRFLVALMLVFCTTLMFAETKTENKRETRTLTIGDNVKGWNTGPLQFTEDTYILEIELIKFNNKIYYKVRFSNDYVQYFDYWKRLYDPDHKEWVVDGGGWGPYFNYIDLYYDPPAE